MIGADKGRKEMGESRPSGKVSTSKQGPRGNQSLCETPQCCSRSQTTCFLAGCLMFKYLDTAFECKVDIFFLYN